MDVPPALLASFGWPEAEATHLASAENETWRVDLPSGPVAVRLYRPGRRSQAEIEAEWAWADALAAHGVPTPTAIDVGGQRVRRVGDRIAVAMQWAPGDPLSYHVEADVYALGRVVGTLRRAATAIMAEQPVSWAGWERPHLYPLPALGDLLETAIDAPYVRHDRASRLSDRVEQLADRLVTGPVDLGWVHADLHAGNVLQSASGLQVIDLDDCLFGPVAIEWATVRVHLAGDGLLASAWPVFCRGVDAEPGSPAPHDAAIRIATALQVLRTLAALPAYAEGVSAMLVAGAIFDRYLGVMAAELDGPAGDSGGESR